MGQGERNEALSALRDGRARVCVATDVAARGLDVPDLGLVIHADLPHDSEVLLHRSGRTGRAGRKGVSVLLVPSNRRRRAESLLAGAGIELFSEAAPSADAVRRLDGIEGISTLRFSSREVVRHPIVGRIVDAYEGPPQDA